MRSLSWRINLGSVPFEASIATGGLDHFSPIPHSAVLLSKRNPFLQAPDLSVVRYAYRRVLLDIRKHSRNTHGVENTEINIRDLQALKAREMRQVAIQGAAEVVQTDGEDAGGFLWPNSVRESLDVDLLTGKVEGILTVVNRRNF